MLIVRIIPVVVKIRVKRKIKLKREKLNWKILWFSNVNHVRIVLCLARGFSHPVCTSFVFLIKKGGVFQFQLAASLWSIQFKSYDIVVMKRNRPFPSSKNSHFQNEAKCETFVVKMSFICIIIKNHFHINGFALSLALKVRFFGTRKWPISF